MKRDRRWSTAAASVLSLAAVAAFAAPQAPGVATYRWVTVSVNQTALTTRGS